MEIAVSEQIKEKLELGELEILQFTASVRSSKTNLWDEINKETLRIRENISSDQITKLPAIAYARTAYKQCGKDPSRYRPSADSLIRRIVKGNDLYRVNNVVDVLNLISLKTGLSIGGYNTKSIEGMISFDIGKTEEEYTGIGRGLLNIEGLPVLRDSISAFGSPTSDSERTSIDKSVSEVMFVFFNFSSDKLPEETISLTKDLLTSNCAATNFTHQIIRL